MLMLNRRTLLRAGSAAAAIGAAALAPNALARAPKVGKQAQPSFYRFKLGAIEITVVSDGTLAFPAETLWGDRAEDARGLLKSTFQPSSPVGLQINTILVNTGDKLVLIDAGCGVDKFQKTTGGLIRNLAAAGYAPGDIDMILLTHAHFDHLWGISDGKNASLLFPSAEFVASETEVAFWSAPDLVGKLSPVQKPLVTQVNLKLASPRLRLIKAGAEVAPGVTTVDTHGHTPGHMSVHISSRREEMLLTGDVAVDSAVSFLHPEWPFEFDLDVPQGTKTRMAFLDRAAADKTLVGSYHLPFPGFGHVVREGSAYRWLPADDLIAAPAGRCAPRRPHHLMNGARCISRQKLRSTQKNQPRSLIDDEITDYGAGRWHTHNNTRRT
jgi:glyoxylase-like metal-dependent hydrolase (beta-lactamase superfamily II)